MAPALTSFLRIRLLAALLLAVIGLQAGQPIRAPLEVQHGSAFNPVTQELALASPRRADVEAAADLVLPSATPVSAIREEWRGRAAQPPIAPALRLPPARAPPRDHPARLPDSTAPPLA